MEFKTSLCGIAVQARLPEKEQVDIKLYKAIHIGGWHLDADRYFKVAMGRAMLLGEAMGDRQTYAEEEC